MRGKGWIILAAAAVLLGGCAAGGAAADGTEGKARQERQGQTELDAEALAEALLQEIGYDKELTRLDADEIANYIDLEDGVEAVMYMSEGSTAEEFGIFTAPDAAAAGRQEEQIESFLEDQKDSFHAYVPEETARLGQAVLEREDRYVVLSVSGDPDTAKKLIREAFEGE